MTGHRQLLCIVTPCYNEAEVVGAFYDALKPVLNALPDLDHRILFVDDGSEDATLEKLNELAAHDARVSVLSLSRNFGHQIALTAGLDIASGDAVLMMDCDLQHPPALLPQMVKLWREGNDVVSAVRQGTADSGFFKRVTSRLFYWSVNKLSDTRVVPGAADFCLLSRQAHEALLQLPERHRFLRGMVSWIGFPRALVPFTAPRRPAGCSKYSRLKMLALALNAIFSFSAAPIRFATHLGLGAIALSLLYLAYILFCFLSDRPPVHGWTSIIFVVAFLGGVQLAFIGVLGEYIGRIFEEVKQRPLSVLKQKPSPEAAARAAPAVDDRKQPRSDAVPLL
jgi:dolichol-phosphate mannosyltransferase